MSSFSASLKTMSAAFQARRYARGAIGCGATQLETNDREPECFDRYANFIEKVSRNLNFPPDFISVEDYSLNTQRHRLARIKKFSVGNCSELSQLAFSYFCEDSNGERIRAEMVQLRNGDHTFLVLNRKPGSIMNKPLTWGEDAIICDPWGNKIFYAKYYLKYLKNYKRINNKNVIFPVTRYHMFIIYKDKTTKYFHAQHRVPVLIINFVKYSKSFQIVLDKLKKTINLNTVLTEQEKFILNKIHSVAGILQQAIEDPMMLAQGEKGNSPPSYDEALTNLNSFLKMIIEKIRSITEKIKFIHSSQKVDVFGLFAHYEKTKGLSEALYEFEDILNPTYSQKFST